ncbi:hypothetical protein Scep_002077 [Stephania cephalantha]|uniref:Uncharacterized protein n=1 Tax=Stephania cephalantha TaxID=152367 RepID=A0AAP0Q8E8_9MAGN
MVIDEDQVVHDALQTLRKRKLKGCFLIFMILYYYISNLYRYRYIESEERYAWKKETEIETVRETKKASDRGGAYVDIATGT